MELLISLSTFCTDNILDDKPEGKGSADKEEQPVDEVPKRMKKSDSTTQSKGKVGYINAAIVLTLNQLTCTIKAYPEEEVHFIAPLCQWVL